MRERERDGGVGLYRDFPIFSKLCTKSESRKIFLAPSLTKEKLFQTHKLPVQGRFKIAHLPPEEVRIDLNALDFSVPGNYSAEVLVLVLTILFFQCVK